VAAKDVVAPDVASKAVDVSQTNVAADGTVCGSIANHSDHPVRDIQLVVRHQWLWNNERHPGKNYPGRAETINVADEIAPGAEAPFNYCAGKPLPQRSDGHFKTSVEVVGFTEVGGEPPAAASSSPCHCDAMHASSR
ncbi:MAG TPA: hypothetical protein VMT89_06335, partial [Candidatus Acidoferrales bacterium]|nr:hypothetical protein [Candidatus Acidoferrales bacterium]